MTRAGIQPAAYGAPPGPSRFDKYQRAIIGYAPQLFFPMDDAAGPIKDYLGRYSMTITTTAMLGAARPSANEKKLFHIQSSTGCFASGVTLAVNPNFTIGATIVLGRVVDTFFFGSWNGNGQGFASTGTNAKFYVNANFTTVTPGAAAMYGVHQWIGTYDGTTATLYIDGVSQGTATPGAATTGQGWGCNNYSNSFKDATYSIADCFVLPTSLSASQVLRLYNIWAGLA